MRLTTLKPLVLLMTLAWGCGGTTESREISQPPIRTGGLLESIPIAFHDTAPDLSDDGTKLVFLSGRDTSDDGAQMRVYRADWPTDGTPGTPERVTSEDLGFEVDAALSPDGATVAVIVSASGQENVYHLPYAGGKMTAVTEDGGSKGQLSFADDSALVAWRQIDGEGRRAFVADLVGGDPVAVASDVERVFWIPTATAGSYRLGVVTRDSTTGLSQLQSASFASAAAAAEATFSNLGGAYHSGDVKLAANASTILASLQPLPLGTESVTRLGDYEVPEDRTLYSSDVDNRPRVTNAGSGAVTTLAEIPGDAMRSPDDLTDGFAFLSRRAYRCTDDSGVLFGWSLLAMSNDTATTSRYLPRRNASGNWEVATDPCDKTGADNAAGQIDHRLQDIAAAANGTVASFRVVFETRFSTKKDADCRLKAGDPEIRVLEVKADASTISSVSDNEYPDLTDTDRGDQGPCP